MEIFPVNIFNNRDEITPFWTSSCRSIDTSRWGVGGMPIFSLREQEIRNLLRELDSNEIDTLKQFYGASTIVVNTLSLQKLKEAKEANFLTLCKLLRSSLFAQIIFENCQEIYEYDTMYKVCQALHLIQNMEKRQILAYSNTDGGEQRADTLFLYPNCSYRNVIVAFEYPNKIMEAVMRAINVPIQHLVIKFSVQSKVRLDLSTIETGHLWLVAHSAGLSETTAASCPVDAVHQSTRGVHLLADSPVRSRRRMQRAQEYQLPAFMHSLKNLTILTLHPAFTATNTISVQTLMQGLPKIGTLVYLDLFWARLSTTNKLNMAMRDVLRSVAWLRCNPLYITSLENVRHFWLMHDAQSKTIIRQITTHCDALVGNLRSLGIIRLSQLELLRGTRGLETLDVRFVDVEAKNPIPEAKLRKKIDASTWGDAPQTIKNLRWFVPADYGTIGDYYAHEYLEALDKSPSQDGKVLRLENLMYTGSVRNLLLLFDKIYEHGTETLKCFNFTFPTEYARIAKPGIFGKLGQKNETNATATSAMDLVWQRIRKLPLTRLELMNTPTHQLPYITETLKALSKSTVAEFSSLIVEFQDPLVFSRKEIEEFLAVRQQMPHLLTFVSNVNQLMSFELNESLRAIFSDYANSLVCFNGPIREIADRVKAKVSKTFPSLKKKE